MRTKKSKTKKRVSSKETRFLHFILNFLRNYSPKQINNQHMHRIKCIASIFEPLRMIALYSFIKPNRNKRQHRQTLLNDVNFLSKQIKRIVKAAQQININIPHTY